MFSNEGGAAGYDLIYSKLIFNGITFSSVHFSSVAQSCPTLWDPMNCSTPGFHVHHQLLEFTQTHVHRVGDAIQPSHPLSFHSPPALAIVSSCEEQLPLKTGPVFSPSPQSPLLPIASHPTHSPNDHYLLGPH